MPRVKIDYVVSFSSEDSENPASNLLANEVSKKKWLCDKGEASGSVVLQLSRTVQISAVHIGAYHAALVEVLVGRSERPNEPFTVLVPSCVFLSPIDSRKGEGYERVRSFSADQLTADVRDKKWDRIRVVCSQPYNKHCKYGLSFIHIFEPEGPASTPTAVAAKPAVSKQFALDTRSSDEEDSFKPGELFAKHLQNKSSTNSSTDAQIRQATSQAINNISDSATKLVKASINRDRSHPSTSRSKEDTNPNRHRNNLMYDDEDDRPNAKIDKAVQRHNDEKRNKDEEATKAKQKSDETPRKKHNSKKDADKFSFVLKADTPKNNKESRNSSGKDSEERKRDRTPQSSKKERDKPVSGRDEKNSKKRRLSVDDSNEKCPKRPRAGPVTSSPSSLLSDVVFVLSGYENPRRATLRQRATALGAVYCREWTPRCTHLICAFPNTPKLRTVRALPGGGGGGGGEVVAVRGEWVEQCHARRRRLPWQWYATEPARLVPRTEDDDDDVQTNEEPECDTDDEIENVLRKQKDERAKPIPTGDVDNHSPTPTRDNMSQDSDVAFVRDERVIGNYSISDSDGEKTEEDFPVRAKEEIDESKTLPDFLEGYTFVVDEDVGAAGFDRELLVRYVRAYGGENIELSRLEEDSEVSYVLSASASCAAANQVPSAQILRADWLWECHRKLKRCSIDKFLFNQ